MDKTVIAKVKRYAEIIKKKYPIKMVILYGSHVSNKAKKNSDIDVAVVFDEIKGDYLEIMTDVYKSAVDIDSKIETVMLEKKRDRSGFLESILRYGKVI